MGNNPPLPQKELKRLKAREIANRKRAKNKGLSALPVSIEGLWLLQKGMCACPRCDFNNPLNPNAKHGDDDHIIIAHGYALGSVVTMGHTPNNVRLWSAGCNKEEAKLEVADMAKQRKFTVNKQDGGGERKPKPKPRIQSRGFPKRPQRSQKTCSHRH